MAKSLTQIVPDFRQALEEGVQQATETIVRDLQVAGPYWTGFFSDMWQVNVGKTAIKADLRSMETVGKEPKTRDYVEVAVPDSPNLQGYTIGNRAAYRLYAMDILTAGTRARANPNARLTAPKKWYDNYINSEMPGVLESRIYDVFRRYR